MAFAGAVGASVENSTGFFVAALDEDSAVTTGADSGVGAGQLRADFENERGDLFEVGNQNGLFASASDGDVEKAAFFGERKRIWASQDDGSDGVFGAGGGHAGVALIQINDKNNVASDTFSLMHAAERKVDCFFSAGDFPNEFGAGGGDLEI